MFHLCEKLLAPLRLLKLQKQPRVVQYYSWLAYCSCTCLRRGLFQELRGFAWCVRPAITASMMPEMSSIRCQNCMKSVEDDTVFWGPCSYDDKCSCGEMALMQLRRFARTLWMYTVVPLLNLTKQLTSVYACPSLSKELRACCSCASPGPGKHTGSYAPARGGASRYRQGRFPCRLWHSRPPCAALRAIHQEDPSFSQPCALIVCCAVVLFCPCSRPSLDALEDVFLA